MAIKLRWEAYCLAPPETVFRALTDLDRMGEWMPGLARAERLRPGELAVGSAFRQTRLVFGREATEQFEVTQLEPPRRLGLFVDGRRGSSGRGEYRFLYTLAPEGPGTRLALEGEISGLGFFGELLGWLMSGFYRKAIGRDIEALRAHLERRLAGGATFRA